MRILLFTSGTTKMSKGVMLSHTNIVSNILSLDSIIQIKEDDVHLSLLPLHHTFENTIGFLFMVHSGVCIAYNEGIRHIVKNMNEFGVSILVAVPAIYEIMYAKLKDGIEKSGKKPLVDMITKLSNGLLKVGIDLRRVFFKSVLAKLSPKLRLMASGAAPIDAEIARGFESMGITFLQGYGLTETSPLVCGTGPLSKVHGTVGHPILGVDVCIDAPDADGMGEILVRGKNVMLGYYESPEETKEVLDPDGWFRTGDLGMIDDNGIVRITGRAKSMIVFANGKKAFPEEYEILLNAADKIKDSFVWGESTGDGDVRICAKIVLHEDVDPEAVKDEIESIVKGINERIPKYKIIHYYVMTKDDLVKTTTLKIKRPIEEKKMRQYIESSGKDMRKLNKTLL
jgi:long-chain acyl-CoA synthetase